MDKRPRAPRTTTRAVKAVTGKHALSGAGARKLLAVNVRRIREERGLTQIDAAELAGLHDRHWQKIEAGTSNATIHTLAGIATALDVPLADLLAPLR